MKIALFVHCFFPDHFYGTETYTLQLARWYQIHGHSVTVVTAVFQGETRRESLLSEYQYEGISVLVIDKNFVPHSRVKETYYQTEMAGPLDSVLSRLDPDIIHVTHLINHTAVLLEVARTRAIPVYATFTDFFGFCLNNKLENVDSDLCVGPNVARTNCMACHLKEAALRPDAAPWIAPARSAVAARAIAESSNIARKFPPIKGGAIDGLLQDIAARPDTLSYLYNDVIRKAVAPTKFLRSAYESNGIRVPMSNIAFGVDIDRRKKPARPGVHVPVIGFIGQLAPHKGADLLVAAFAGLPRGKARLVVYGPEDQDPPHVKKLRSLAEGTDVEFRGTFISTRTAEVMAEIDLLVIPSRWYENSPLVLLNALATHTPVLVSDVAGMTEFVTQGENGWVFERGNVDNLSAVLLKLVTDPSAIYDASAHTHYEKTPETMALETLALYA